jgi:hypothetical protein
VRWRCIDLREEVARRYQVTAHESTVGKWLRGLGLTRLQPRPFHPQKDATAEAAFKKLGASINAVLFWLPVLWRRWGKELGLLARA